MADEKDKSLDQQIKEAELAKLKAETAEVEKRSKQTRVMGVPLVQIIFGGIVVGFVLLNYIQPLVDLNTNINSKEKEYDRIEFSLRNKILQARADTLEQLADSLNTEQIRLSTLNDSLTRETDSLEQQTKEATDELASVQERIAALNAQEKELRASIESEKIRVKITEVFGALDSAYYASVLKQYQMIKAKNYYDGYLNPEGKGIANQFQPQPGDSVIFDAATGLYWQQSGSGYNLSYRNAEKYIRQINDEAYGGYSDWRLPTLEETMSLMEPEPKKYGFHIDEQFDDRQSEIWTSDKFRTSAWVVYFNPTSRRGAKGGFCRYQGGNLGHEVRAVR